MEKTPFRIQQKNPNNVFNLFKSKSKIKNRDLIFKNMEIYYTHLFNKVKSKDFILNYLKFILII